MSTVLDYSFRATPPVSFLREVPTSGRFLGTCIVTFSPLLATFQLRFSTHQSSLSCQPRSRRPIPNVNLQHEVEL